MGWKEIRRILLGCCGTGTQTDEDIQSDDLHHPRNEVFVPRPKTGYRAYYAILEDGEVVKLKNPPKLYDLPGFETEVHPQDSANATDDVTATSREGANEMIENNRDIFLDTWEPRVQARVIDSVSTDDKTSFYEKSTDCEYEGYACDVDEISKQMSNLSVRTSTEEDIVVKSAENRGKDREIHEENSHRTVHGPTHEGTRKRKLTQREESTHSDGIIRSADNSNDQVGTALGAHGDNEAHLQSDDDINTFMNFAKTTKDCNRWPIIPLLSESPDAFWKMLRALSEQLVPLLNPSGPKVTRLHNWKTDGCICCCLFPPLKQTETSGGRRSFTTEYLNSIAVPLSTRQLPLPPKAVLSPMNGYKPVP